MDLFKIVPQVFFDILGRIIPGFVAVFIFSLQKKEYWDKVKVYIHEFFNSKPEAEISIWFIVGLSFVVGHLFSPLAKGIQRLNKLVFIKIFRELEKDKSVHDGYEWLRLYKPEAGGLCAKIRAEFTMYNTLAGVFIVFAVEEFFRCNSANGVFFVFLFALTAIRGAETEETFNKSVKSLYRFGK